MDDEGWSKMRNHVNKWISHSHGVEFVMQFATWLGVERAYRVCAIFTKIREGAGKNVFIESLRQTR